MEDNEFPTLVNWANKTKPATMQEIADYFADEVRFGQKDLTDASLRKLCNAMTPEIPIVEPGKTGNEAVKTAGANQANQGYTDIAGHEVIPDKRPETQIQHIKENA